MTAVVAFVATHIRTAAIALLPLLLQLLLHGSAAADPPAAAEQVLSAEVVVAETCG